jgi:hypothetical protein
MLFSVVRVLPMPSKLSNAKPMGSILLWQFAQAALAAWASNRARVVFDGSAAGKLTTIPTTPGSGTSWQAMRRRTATPRNTGWLLLLFANTDRKAPWLRMPRRLTPPSDVL